MIFKNGISLVEKSVDKGMVPCRRYMIHKTCVAISNFSVYLLPISCDNYIYRLQEFLQGIYLKISTDPSMASSWFLISTPLENLTSMP